MEKNESVLSRLEARVCRWLLKRVVKQGYHHQEKMTAVFSEFHEIARKEFYEDSIASIDSFMLECFHAGRNA